MKNEKVSGICGVSDRHQHRVRSRTEWHHTGFDLSTVIRKFASSIVHVILRLKAEESSPAMGNEILRSCLTQDDVSFTMTRLLETCCELTAGCTKYTEVTMATDFYGNTLIASDRARARHMEAKAHRLANTVGKDNRTRHSVLKGAGQALNRVIQVVLCKLLFTVRAISFAKKLSPCSESPGGYHTL